MQAVILAAGFGKRLRPLTNELPKPMVKVSGIPILEYTLSILPKEIEEVIIVVSYMKEKIIDYFGDSYRGLPIKYVEQKSPNGTADALDEAKPFLKKGYFLFLYGDDLYHQDDLKSLVSSNEPVVLVKKSKNPELYGVCLVDKDGYLSSILEKRENPPSDLVNIGVYLMDEEIFSIPRVQLPNGEYNLAEQIGHWASVRKIKVQEARFWHPIGYIEDLEKAHGLLEIPSPERRN